MEPQVIHSNLEMIGIWLRNLWAYPFYKFGHGWAGILTNALGHALYFCNFFPITSQSHTVCIKSNITLFPKEFQN